MDIETPRLPGHDFSPAKSDVLPRVKSSLRLQYEAQVRVIRHQIGGLEKVRQELGLSQRKMAQLLLVDPSAWTRWTQNGEDAPPHVWRALQWYLTVREKLPGLTPAYFTGGDSRLQQEKTLGKIEAEKREREAHILSLENRLFSLEKSLSKWRRGTWLFAAGLLIVFTLFLRAA